MMRSLSTVVEIKAGQTAPDEYMECLLKAGATIWGAAILTGGEIIVNKSNAPTLQKFKDLRSLFPDAEMVLHFSDLKDPVDVKSRQPFVLQSDEKGQPAIVAFVEGDYSKHAIKDGVASDEYYMVKEVLEPLVETFWTATNCNPDDTLKFIENKMQTKIILDAAGERGTVILVSSGGKITSIARNDQDATTEWGEVSRHHDYGQDTIKEPEEKKPEPEKRAMSPSELMALAMGDYDGAPITVETKSERTATILAEAKKENLASTAPAPVPKDFVRLQVPTASNSQRKDFFTDVLKMPLPADWKTRDYIDVPLRHCPPKFLPKEPVVEPAKNTTPVHVTNAQTATKTNGSVPPVTQSVIVPIIPIAQIKAFKETFLNSADVRKIMQEHGGKVPTEKELEEMQARFPDWSKQTDTPIEATAFYSHTADLLLCREYPNLAATLMGTYRRGYFTNFKAPSAAVQDNVQKQQASGGARRR